MVRSRPVNVASADGSRTRWPANRAVGNLFGFGIVLVGFVLTLTACSGDDTFLPALLADPMASYEAEGLELSDSWEYGQRGSFLGSAPVQAEVGRRFRIENQELAEQLLEEAVAFAESEGWSMAQPLADNPDYYSGARDLVPGPGSLSVFLVAVDPINDPNGPKQLGVNLRFDQVPTD